MHYVFVTFIVWLAATSKTTVYKAGIGKYIATDAAPALPKGEDIEGATGVVRATDKETTVAKAPEDDVWANVVPVKKNKIQPKAGFGDFSSW